MFLVVYPNYRCYVHVERPSYRCCTNASVLIVPFIVSFIVWQEATLVFLLQPQQETRGKGLWGFCLVIHLDELLMVYDVVIVCYKQTSSLPVENYLLFLRHRRSGRVTEYTRCSICHPARPEVLVYLHNNLRGSYTSFVYGTSTTVTSSFKVFNQKNVCYNNFVYYELL